MRFVLLRLFRLEKQGINDAAFTATKIESDKGNSQTNALVHVF